MPLTVADGIIAEHSPALRRLCERFGVRRLEIFGSATTDHFQPDRSDLDLLVEYDASPSRDPYERYFGLVAALEGLLGRKVDLVDASVIENPYFLRRVNRERRVVYAA